MPSCPRDKIFDPDVVGLYHCFTRTVRRAWICGFDPLTQKDYEYRRNWIVQREALLVQFYGVEVCFHAEMSNHIHLILRNRPDVVETWSDEEVVRRILIINQLTRSFDSSYNEPKEVEIRLELADPHKVKQYRQRLSHISFFMASLDEHISRRANHEDQVSGHFWDGRFKCRSLEDQSSLLVCGMYLDLNQVRAGEVLTPEESVHTSAHDRIRGYQERADEAQRKTKRKSRRKYPDSWLCELSLAEGPVSDIPAGLSSKTPWRATDKGLLPIRIEDYLSLLDWTGRQKAAGKSGAIPAHLASILERLHISGAAWLETVTNFNELFGRAVGRAFRIAQRAADAGQSRIRGQRNCERAFT